MRLALSVLPIAFAAAAIGTVLEPAVFKGSENWRPARPAAYAVQAREYPTVNVGDTITIAFTTSNADTACFKAIGGARLVARPCQAGGFRVYMRGYVRKVAISADSVSYATKPQLATLASACDSALAAMGFRGDSALDPTALPSPACDDFKSRVLRP